MKVIADTNVLFSALLKSNSKELEIFESEKINVVVPSFTFFEIFKHKERIVKASKLSENEILESYLLLIKYSTVLNVTEIPKNYIKEAYRLCHDVDEKDTIFIASSKFLDCRLWTKDKALIDGLIKKRL